MKGIAMPEPAIQVEAVKKHYGALEVLKGVDLTIPEGQFSAIIGKSGSGKSTCWASSPDWNVRTRGRCA